jgi:hypothetical protein
VIDNLLILARADLADTDRFTSPIAGE